MPWKSDSEIRIDRCERVFTNSVLTPTRFDGRALLEDIPPSTIVGDDDKELEELLNFERYHELVTLAANKG